MTCFACTIGCLAHDAASPRAALPDGSVAAPRSVAALFDAYRRHDVVLARDEIGSSAEDCVSLANQMTACAARFELYGSGGGTGWDGVFIAGSLEEAHRAASSGDGYDGPARFVGLHHWQETFCGYVTQHAIAEAFTRTLASSPAREAVDACQRACAEAACASACEAETHERAGRATGFFGNENDCSGADGSWPALDAIFAAECEARLASIECGVSTQQECAIVAAHERGVSVVCETPPGSSACLPGWSAYELAPDEDRFALAAIADQIEGCD